MTDYKGRTIKKVDLATAVEILGLTDVPQAGDEFNAVKEDKVARKSLSTEKKAERRNPGQKCQHHFGAAVQPDQRRRSEGTQPDYQEANVQGICRRHGIPRWKKLNNENVRCKHHHTIGVGTVTESDVMLAGTSSSIIIGFNAKTEHCRAEYGRQENIQIRTYRVIYDVLDDVENAMKGMLDPEFKEEILGKVEIRKYVQGAGSRHCRRRLCPGRQGCEKRRSSPGRETELSSTKARYRR